jgi:hypothetical protein
MRTALLLVALLASTAFADKRGGRKPKAPAATAATPASPVTHNWTLAPEDVGPRHKEGEYGGVTPGQAPDSAPTTGPVRPKKIPPKGTLSWVGFEAKDGGAQLFLQSAATFEVTQRVDGSTLVVFLGLPHLGANTWRQVDTRFFDNPLSGVIAKSVGGGHGHGAGIEVRVAFKNPKDAKEAAVRTATEADGMFYTYLSFPEGADKDTTTAKDPEK